MKKFYIMLLALILALAMIVPMTIPVAADPPTDTKKPVAWVNGADCTNNDYAPLGILSSSISVKYLSNETTVGKVVTKALDKVENVHIIVHSTTFDQNETYWWRDGDTKYFQFVYIEPEGTKYRITCIDNGEGKNSDTDANYWEIWAPIGDPPVWMWVPFFGLTPLPNGNNQIHLPDDPVDDNPSPYPPPGL